MYKTRNVGSHKFWRVVQKFVPRNIYEAGTSADYENSGDEDDNPIVEAYQEDGEGINLFVDLGALELLPLCRDDVPPVHLDPSVLNDHSIQVSLEEDEEDEELNVSISAANCLALFTKCLRNEAPLPILCFVSQNIGDRDWRKRQAACVAFGTKHDLVQFEEASLRPANAKWVDGCI